jgi:hypothetical protein
VTVDVAAIVERAQAVGRTDWRINNRYSGVDEHKALARDVLALAEEVRRYQRALVEHHATHNLSDDAVRESLGWTCQICARAAKKVSA